uniref:Uncharacterized protein n=1 Tax=Geobacter sp. (strain M21) TaxID=443144 RepID=C6E4T5_GEOSM
MVGEVMDDKEAIRKLAEDLLTHLVHCGHLRHRGGGGPALQGGHLSDRSGLTR